MIERAMRFGPERNLVGILTERASSDDAGGAEERPAFIFLNSGILHRVGASRLYVTSARRLAEAGFVSLRFDHAGVGDSEVRRGNGGFVESAIAEARAAMDLLEEQRGARHFILVGLCSGADMAYWTALEDERVVGLAQLDPFAYRTRGYLRRHYLPRLVSPRAWWKSLRARTLHLVRGVRAWREGEPEESVWLAPEYTRVFPPRAEVSAGLARLTDRGVAFWAFLSGGLSGSVNYAGQYAESFSEVDWGDRLTEVFIPEAAHTVTNLDHQERAVASLEAWALRHWGEGGAGGTGAARVPAQLIMAVGRLTPSEAGAQSDELNGGRR